MKLILILVFTFISFIGFAQNKPGCYNHFKKEPSHLLFGLKKTGIGFGGFGKINGLNLCLIDKTCRLNGVGLSLFGQLNTRKKTNGLEIGLAPCVSKMNGVFVGLLGGAVDYDFNGVGIAGILGDFGNTNGILICPVNILSGNTIGVSLTGISSVQTSHVGLGISAMFFQVDENASGIFFSGISFNSEILNGSSFSIINSAQDVRGVQFGFINKAKLMTGFQFGLVNVIKENPRVFRTLPVLNFNFSKAPVLTVHSDSISSSDSIYLGRITTNFYPSGKLLSKSFVGHDNYVLVKDYYENGALKHFSETFKDSKMDVYYYKNGAIRSKTNSELGCIKNDYWIYKRNGKMKRLVRVNRVFDNNFQFMLWEAIDLFQRNKIR